MHPRMPEGHLPKPKPSNLSTKSSGSQSAEVLMRTQPFESAPWATSPLHAAANTGHVRKGTNFMWRGASNAWLGSHLAQSHLLKLGVTSHTITLAQAQQQQLRAGLPVCATPQVAPMVLSPFASSGQPDANCQSDDHWILGQCRLQYFTGCQVQWLQHSPVFVCLRHAL